MRVLMISLEKGLVDPRNRARARIASYGSFVEQLDIILFSSTPFAETIHPNVHVTSTGSRSPLWYVWDALRIVWRKRTEHYDVVTAQDVTETGLVGYIAARLFRARFAAQDVGYLFHGDYYARESFLNRLRSGFAHWLMRRADSIRVMSIRTEQALQKNLAIDSSKIIRSPFQLDAQFTAQEGALSSEELTLLKGRPYFLVPARFVLIKRIDLAIAAFADLAKHDPTILLVLLGQGPLLDDFKQQITREGLSERIYIRPWTSSLAAWYRGAIATLIPSDREGYAMTALESLASGTPVIMTDVGCAPELIVDGKNGYIIPVGDQALLAVRLKDAVLHAEELRAEAKKFTWQPPKQGMKELWERALIDKRAPSS